MIVVGILLMTFALAGVFIYSFTDAEDGSDVGMGFFFCILFIMGLIATIGVAVKDEPTEKSLKDNVLRVEIRTSTLNGKETERDTVYIFTPREKE